MRGKRIIGVTLSALLVTAFSLSPAGMTNVARQAAAEIRQTKSGQATGEISTQSVELKEGTYKPNQVIIEYDKNYLHVEKSTETDTKKKLSVKSARKDKHAAKTFGNAMKTTMNSGKAAATFPAQKDLLAENLGEDFVIEDTICIEGENGLVYSLVSSDKYSTDEMIEKLKDKKGIYSVSPNSIIRKQSVSDVPAYTLNDPLSYSLYQQNAPSTVNTAGRMTSSRGYDPAGMASQNISIAWEKNATGAAATAAPEVVAVVDSGVYAEHEDLRDNMWINPGNIGLRGDHGYDFVHNSDKLIDDFDHGTHCAGIIAATSGNGIGIAGATNNGVKIMGLKILNSDGAGISDDNLFDVYAAYSYIIKAKKKGVNIHFVNNSWAMSDCIIGDSSAHILEIMYDLGITLLFAAGNDSSDNDLLNCAPPSDNAPNIISVGALREDGEPAAFTNYGNESVDLFTPGQNILSTVANDTYLPCTYDSARLNRTTEIYGEFSADMATVSAFSGKPTVGDDINHKSNSNIVNTFEAPRFSGPAGTSMELGVRKDNYVSESTNPASLSVKIKGLKKGETCYLWFPYNKSKYSDGTNTYYSMVYNFLAKESNSDLKAYPGEVVQYTNGTVSLPKGKEGRSLSGDDDRLMRVKSSSELISYAEACEARVASYGIGFMITAASAPDEDSCFVLGFDSLAVSKPGISKEDFGKYCYFSGTSMACPAAVGFAAELARMYPEGSAEAGKKRGRNYVDFFRKKLFSMTTHSEKLEGKCSTEGYLDFRRLTDPSIVIDKMTVDASKKTITLIGSGLDTVTNLYYKRLIGEGEKTEIPMKTSSGLRAVKNKNGSITIKNATSLIGTYTRFYAEKPGLSGTGASFLVNGEKAFSKINMKEEVNTSRIFTDKKGKYVYCTLEDPIGDIVRLNLSKGTCTPLHKKSFGEQLAQYLYNKGAIPYSIIYHENHAIEINHLNEQPLCEKGVYRAIMRVDMDSEYAYVLATIDVNVKKPKWKFRLLNSIPDTAGIDAYAPAIGMIGKYIYMFGGRPESDEPETLSSRKIYRMDTSTGEWKKMSATLPVDLGYSNTITYKGSIYLIAGYVMEKDNISRNPSIYRYDGKKLKCMKTKIQSDFRGWHAAPVNEEGYHPDQIPALAPTKNGILIYGISIDGYGNTCIYNPKKDKLSPVYATVEPGLCIGMINFGVMTKKGFCVARFSGDETINHKESKFYLLKPGKDTFSLP